MIRDLAGGGPMADVAADVAVIGGGIAGLIAATRLARKGLAVVVLESGGEHQEADEHPLNAVVHVRATYAGAAHGRFRCIGGTSTRWGGAMIPFLPADLHGRYGDWPVDHAALTAYQGEVEALFGLPGTPYTLPDLLVRTDGTPPHFLPRLAKWPAFAKRNVAALLTAELRDERGPATWLNATATGFDVDTGGVLRAVTAEAPDGARLTVRAKQYLVAAGAIESTRLLLLADRQHGGRLFARDDVLGRYFHDHLSVRVGMLAASDRTALNRIAGFRFEGAGMRNLRFEPGEAPATRAEIPAGFAHIAFTSPPGSGFDAMRDVYRQLQKRRAPSAAALARIARAAPWLVRAGWWRYVEHRLLYPADADIELHMVVEQEPRADNRVTLAKGPVDMFGQPLAAIDWAPSPRDAASLTRATDLFLEDWAASPLARIATIARRPAAETLAELAEGGGIYHPGGSTRMGRDPGTGVVDDRLRTFRVPNLRVAATSVFPTGGGANPTMMLMMAAMRAADGIAAEV